MRSKHDVSEFGTSESESINALKALLSDVRVVRTGNQWLQTIQQLERLTQTSV